MRLSNCVSRFAATGSAIKNENLKRINASRSQPAAMRTRRYLQLRYLIRPIELKPTRTSFAVSGVRGLAVYALCSVHCRREMENKVRRSYLVN